MRKTCAFYTLGCKVNQYDTESLMNMFRDRGYEIVDFDEPADVYCINTCTVTSISDRKSRQAIRRARATNPKAIVAVVGCYAQAAPEEVSSLPGVNVIVGTHGRGQLVDLVERVRGPEDKIVATRDIQEATEFEELPVKKVYGRTRAGVKIQEGCDSYCSYCRVPYARGRVRSRLPENVIREVKGLVEAGYKEIVLEGIHIGAYGRDLGPASDGKRRDLAWILAQICEVLDGARIRLGSVEPREVTRELVDVMAGCDRIARHLHIPLESGSNDILRLMNRPYTREYYRDLVNTVRERIPGIAVTTDIMVGFPQETEERFIESLEFVREMAFARIHVFRYSRRPGTRASGFGGQVPEKAKRERSERMLALGQELALAFHQRFIGEELSVLFEEFSGESPTLNLPASPGSNGAAAWDPPDGPGTGNGWLWGFSDNYIRVTARGCRELTGKVVPVRLLMAFPEYAVGIFDFEKGF